MSDPERGQLQARYRQLVLRELPRLATAGRWVVRADHCFGRIVLDRRRGPAFTQLSDDQLRSAITLGERILAEGDPLLRRLNEQSLRWRGK